MFAHRGEKNLFRTYAKTSAILLLFPIIVAIFCHTILAVTTTQTSETFRLPGNVVPETYNLVIYTNLSEDEFGYWGNVQITIRCVEPTNNIILHSKNLTLYQDEVTVQLINGNVFTNIQIIEQSFNATNDFYLITLDEKLVIDSRYLIYIPFEGPLEAELEGYYRSSYVDEQTQETRWLSVTEFDPMGARSAFPCFDELNYTALFTISLGHDENLVALSNMNFYKSESILDLTGWVLDVFYESVPLAPSIVAFTISDFVNTTLIEPIASVPIRLWARKDLIESAELAIETTTNAMTFFNQYFDYKFPLSKLDVVAIPDFVTGSESNFGLMLFREQTILFDSQTNTEYNRRNVITFAIRQTSNQWFGNLVIPEWWSREWIDEAVATFMELITTDVLYPDWNYSNRQFPSSYLNALSADSSEASHPLYYPIRNQTDIDQIYDTITYEKGLCMMRLLEVILGDEILQQGLSIYLNRFAYRKTVQDDFWYSLMEAATAANYVFPSNINIKSIMDSWTLKAGYPYFFVSINYETYSIKVTQERYLFENKTEEEAVERKKYCWSAPILYTTSIELNFDEHSIKQWITCDGPLEFQEELSENDWIILNIGVAVPCQINYSDHNWEVIKMTLADATNYSLIAVKNRMQLINDLFSFAAADIFGYPFVFDTITYLEHEMEWPPWSVAFSALRDIRTFLHRTYLYEPFQACVRKFLKPVYQRLGTFGVVPADYYEADFKFQVTFWACEYGIESCETPCLETLRNWEAEAEPDKNNPINLEIRSLVYCQALKFGNEDDWNFMWNRYLNSQVPLEKAAILDTLGCTRIVSALQKFLESSLDSTVVRKQDSFDVFFRAADSKAGFPVVKEFLFTRFQDIYNYQNGDPVIIGQYLPVLFSLVRTQEEYQEVLDFTNSVRSQLVGTESQLNEAIDYAQSILDWIAKYESVFADILTED